MLAADCANVGLLCKAICCSSSSVMVFCSEAGACARPGDGTRNNAQEKHSTNRDTQRSNDTVAALTSITFIRVIKLFMLVLHAGHIHLHRFIAFLLFSQLQDLVVFVLRQHAYERHHSSRDVGRSFPVCRPFDPSPSWDLP